MCVSSSFPHAFALFSFFLLRFDKTCRCARLIEKDGRGIGFCLACDKRSRGHRGHRPSDDSMVFVLLPLSISFPLRLFPSSLRGSQYHLDKHQKQSFSMTKARHTAEEAMTSLERGAGMTSFAERRAVYFFQVSSPSKKKKRRVCKREKRKKNQTLSKQNKKKEKKKR